jgi:hypothetical protein
MAPGAGRGAGLVFGPHALRRARAISAQSDGPVHPTRVALGRDHCAVIASVDEGPVEARPQAALEGAHAPIVDRSPRRPEGTAGRLAVDPAPPSTAKP